MMAPANEILLATSPELVAGINWAQLPLSPRDGFVLSRIDGLTPAQTLADVCGMGPNELLDVLRRLESVGAIRWSERAGGAQAASPPAGATSSVGPGPQRPVAEARPTGAAFSLRPPVPIPPASAGRPGAPPPAPSAPPSATAGPAAVVPSPLPRKGRGDVDPADPELNEKNDLSVEERRVILSVERRLDQLTFWDLLELHGTPTSAMVKQAYFAQSRRFHPDRYFGKELGSYKGRLENVFKSIRAAYVVLAEDDEREKYAQLHQPPRFPTPLDGIALAWGASAGKAAAAPEPPPKAVTEEELERHRKAIIEQRRKRRSVPAFSLELAKQAFQKGQELAGAGDVAGAEEAYRRALAHDPGNLDYRARFEETKAQVDETRVIELAKQGEAAVAAGQARTAADRFAQAFELAPGDFGHAIRAAELYVEVRQFGPAWQLIQQVIACAPRRRDCRLLAARILEERGDAAGALLQLQTVAQVDGLDPHLERLMSRLSGKSS